MDSEEILTYQQTEQYVRDLTYFPLNEIGSSSWFKQHTIIQKLNMQAHRNISFDIEEFVSELIQTYDKYDILIKQLFAHQILRKNVINPMLKTEYSQTNLVKAQIYLYAIRFSEAIIVDLLAVRAVDQLFTSKYIPEVIDYIAESLNQIITNDYFYDYKLDLTDLNLESELVYSASDIDFKRNCAILTLLRAVSCHELAVSETYRLKSNRIQVKTAQILGISPPPWIREKKINNKIQFIEIFENLEWKKFEEISEIQFKLFALPAQLWISLIGLARLQEQFTSVEIDSFGAIKSKISESFIDQIPQLKDVRLYYEKLVLNQQQTELQQHQAKVQQDFGNDEFLQKPISVEVVSSLTDTIIGEIRKKFEVKNQNRIEIQTETSGVISLKNEVQTVFSDAQIFYELTQVQTKRLSHFDINTSTIVDQFDKVYPTCFCGQIARSRCSKCKKIWYCGRECQLKDWKSGHKKTCGQVLKNDNEEIQRLVRQVEASTK
ncbi:MYND finger domain-containing protein [Spironucleus salmonicida]|uniref:MYND finger domain-containing protein n=1 Tax=Spironucleus salmonicida TaxID=348837 RepID=V6LMF2_9EUKA|nr:MYND finger domain-containing protein [Spironucleus salmonicida]|eukprot:EST45810.1 MYND finger family protein [Spironucleus salmonicida]